MNRCLLSLCRSASPISRWPMFQRLLATSSITMSHSSKLVLADRIKNETESVWVELMQLALEYKPINLGQGFPDYAAPAHVTQALANATLSENVLLNQYTRGFGHPRLVQAISRLYSQLINRPIDAQKEVLVTGGAYEALYCAILGLINPGDEVIILEPYFDCYEPMVRQAGGIPIFVPFRLSESKRSNESVSSSDWQLDADELANAFNSKTKMIILNTPHNPLGKVLSSAELRTLADLCIKHDVIALMDEVYEWLVYEGRTHERMAAIPEMWDRTITVGSAGKTFSVTGWKLGWAYGPAYLMRALQLVHQNTLYTCATPLQEAVAVGFETEMARLNQPDSYWKQLAAELQQKRDRMSSFLIKAGLQPTVPEGGYFMLANFDKLASKINIDSEKHDLRDYRFVYYMTKQKGLQGIPPSAFYSPEHKNLAQDLVRYCFFKKDETLNAAENVFNQIQ